MAGLYFRHDSCYATVQVLKSTGSCLSLYVDRAQLDELTTRGIRVPCTRDRQGCRLRLPTYLWDAELRVTATLFERHDLACRGLTRAGDADGRIWPGLVYLGS